MPVRLDKIPAAALRPSSPNIWLWLGLLPLFLLLGAAVPALLATQPIQLIPRGVWVQALSVPTLAWCLLGAGRFLLYLGAHHRADGWDLAREEDLAEQTRLGRRALHVLSTSVYTALRTPDQSPAAQLEALRTGHSVLTSQPSRLAPEKLCRSRLPGDPDIEPKRALLKLLRQVLTDVSSTLARLPEDKPLALLLEIDSGLSEKQWRRVWRQAWSESAIRQPGVPVEGNGLAVIDQRLDQHTDDAPLLLVVALQFAPSQPQGTAEVAVGLLLGSHLNHTSATPIANLHRPQQEHELTADGLRHAIHQSLDWVPLPAASVEQVWQAGVNVQRNGALTTALFHAPIAQGHPVYNLDNLLGCAGTAAPWLAIATAAQSLQHGAGPQLIFSGDNGVHTGLWATALTPVSPLSN